MFRLIFDKIQPAFMLLLLMSIILGVVYPCLVMGIGQLCFPFKANGSLITLEEKIIGSALIGQYFSDPKYFWGRVSATKPFPYNARASLGSNLGPTNPMLIEKIKQTIELYSQYDVRTGPIPIDLVTASGSGLDPEISPLAAYYQVSRIAKARNIPAVILQEIIKKQTKGRFLGILGEPRLNVLELNLYLDQYQYNSKVKT